MEISSFDVSLMYVSCSSNVVPLFSEDEYIALIIFASCPFCDLFGFGVFMNAKG